MPGRWLNCSHTEAEAPGRASDRLTAFQWALSLRTDCGQGWRGRTEAPGFTFSLILMDKKYSLRKKIFLKYLGEKEIPVTLRKTKRKNHRK